MSDPTTSAETPDLLERAAALLPGIGVGARASARLAARDVLRLVADWLEEQARVKHPDRPSASVALLRSEVSR